MTGGVWTKNLMRPMFRIWKEQTVFRSPEDPTPAAEEEPETGDGEEKAAAGPSTAPEGPKDRLSAIAEAGGIVPLVGLVTTGNAMSKERAASAL